MSSVTGIVGSQTLTVVSNTGRIDPYAILEMNMEAIGGKDKFSKENFFYYKGEIDSSDETLIYEEWTKKPLMSLVKVTEGDTVKFSYGDDGKNIWTVKEGKLNSFDDSSSDDRYVRRKYENLEYLDPQNNNFSVSSTRMANIDGVRCFEVKIKNRKTDEVRTQYYDASTYLLKREIKSTGSSQIQTDYSKYQDVSGIKVAHKRVIKNLTANTEQTINFSEITRGEYVSSEKFKAPATEEKPNLTDTTSATQVGLNIDTYA